MEKSPSVSEDLRPHLLLDFDWKLKYAVSSNSIAAVHEPLARLELCLSSDPVTVEKSNIVAPNVSQEKPRVVVAEYSKVELDVLISDLEAVVQALEGTERSA